MPRTMMASAALFLALGACSADTLNPAQPDQGGVSQDGLVGTVRLGPIQPVCQVDSPCDAPLQAAFTLQQDSRVVARFSSDSTGHFLVYAAPGKYLVVPVEPIGIGVQTPEVTVRAGGLTHLDLAFDTGIR